MSHKNLNPVNPAKPKRVAIVGANYIQAGLWKGFAIRDGNLVNGLSRFTPSFYFAPVVFRIPNLLATPFHLKIGQL